MNILTILLKQVGIDGSSYGYSALQVVVTEHVLPNDKIITYHFPLNFTVKFMTTCFQISVQIKF